MQVQTLEQTLFNFLILGLSRFHQKKSIITSTIGNYSSYCSCYSGHFVNLLLGFTSGRRPRNSPGPVIIEMSPYRKKLQNFHIGSLDAVSTLVGHAGDGDVAKVLRAEDHQQDRSAVMII